MRIATAVFVLLILAGVGFFSTLPMLGKHQTIPVEVPDCASASECREIGNELFGQSAFPEAIAAYSKSLAFEWNAEVNERLGIALYKIGEMEGAAERFKTGISYAASIGDDEMVIRYQKFLKEVEK